MDWLLNWIDLFIMILNIVAVAWWALYIAGLATLNWLWQWDEQVQKKRVESMKKSGFYIWISLVIIDIIFWVLTQFWFFKMADNSHAKVSNFLQQWVDNIEQGNYTAPLTDDNASDYDNNGWGEAINLR